MGIKNLWTVLAPFSDRKPLFELQGKTVAVDLSCWICEAQNIAEYQVQPRMYLRNLYFRTCYLLLMDVNPVFVLEGKAPELKYDTIASRNAIQFKGAKPKTSGVKTGKDRSRFHFVLRQCEEMLGYMGLACIKGKGEAESLCAYLNEDGLVDGCISQDSDCFAYGAQVVYRNFSISTQGVHAASGGAVDIYDLRKAKYSLDFGRNKIVAMALLIGCDYSEGIHGVGKDSVLKFFESVTDDNVLDRLRSWKADVLTFAEYEKKLNDKNICTSCGHFGKVQAHTKNGCTSCGTLKGCDSSTFKEERIKLKNEVNMRSKAMQDPNFPNEALIEEFLKRKDNVSHLSLNWKQPNLVQFVKFTVKFLQWEELYAFEKIFPILTRWQCKNPGIVKTGGALRGFVQPKRIKKVRNPKGVPSYEIIWTDSDGCFKGIIPEEQLNDVNLETLWSTIEPQSIVERAYPDLVEQYNQSKLKPKKNSKRKKKDNLAEELANLSISEPVSKKIRKPRISKKKDKISDGDKATPNNVLDVGSDVKCFHPQKTKTKPPESYVKRAVLNSYNRKGKECSIDAASSPFKGDSNNSIEIDFNLSSFGDEDDLDVSDIVNQITSRKMLPFDEIVEHQNVEIKDLPSSSGGYYKKYDDDEVVVGDDEEPQYHDIEFNSSSFFISNQAENEDLFEKTFNEMLNKESSGSETEEYDFNDDEIKGQVTNNLNENEESRKCQEDGDEDSFHVEHVPLYERLKCK